MEKTEELCNFFVRYMSWQCVHVLASSGGFFFVFEFVQKLLPLDQIAQSLIQPGLDFFKEWGIHNFSGQPVAVFAPSSQ